MARPRRYEDNEILAELAACAERVGRSPTMREFNTDPDVRIHPQTVIERFGTWNAAKRRAGLPARRFATRDELLEQLRVLGAELGRVPRGRDLDERRESMPSKSLYWYSFGSFRSALREAGFDVPTGDERVERATAQGLRIARALKRVPSFADWAKARRADPRLLSEWQVYRLFGGTRGAWSSFQLLVRDRLADESGVSRRREPRARRGGRGTTAAPPARARRGASAR
jgi:hypothetical protein